MSVCLCVFGQLFNRGERYGQTLVSQLRPLIGGSQICGDLLCRHCFWGHRASAPPLLTFAACQIFSKDQTAPNGDTGQYFIPLLSHFSYWMCSLLTQAKVLARVFLWPLDRVPLDPASRLGVYISLTSTAVHWSLDIMPTDPKNLAGIHTVSHTAWMADLQCSPRLTVYTFTRLHVWTILSFPVWPKAHRGILRWKPQNELLVYLGYSYITQWELYRALPHDCYSTCNSLRSNQGTDNKESSQLRQQTIEFID